VEAPNENINPNPPLAPIPIQPRASFADPAILSMGKRPTPVSQNHIQIHTQWNAASMERADSSRTVTSRDDRALQDITPTISLADSLHDIRIAEVEAEGIPESIILSELEGDAEAVTVPQLEIKHAAKRTRRKKVQDAGNESEATPAKLGRQNARSQGRQKLGEEQDSLLLTPSKSKQSEGKRNQQSTGRSKGWRQTPLLEPNPSFQPFETLQKQRRGRNARKVQLDENGWGTEDATDVQDMGDFDFAGSLAKFDKQSVFTQIQAEDGTADEDRLVSHNRLVRAKPGTAGGKNLHYTENVLDSPNGTSHIKKEDWKSDADDSALDERKDHRDTGSGRASRRAESKLPAKRKSTSRKGSSTISAAQVPPPRSLSVRIYEPILTSLVTLAD